MVSLITPQKAQKKISENVRMRRLQMELTQEGLALRSGVPLPTLRKFEQKGLISLESFLKIAMVLGGLEDIVEATAAREAEFNSIDEVLKVDSVPPRKRGKYK